MILGHRVYPNEEGVLLLGECEYGQARDGNWYARPPNSDAGKITGMWQIIVHEDETITILPSIDTGTWHGFLAEGVWNTLQ